MTIGARGDVVGRAGDAFGTGAVPDAAADADADGGSDATVDGVGVGDVTVDAVGGGALGLGGKLAGAEPVVDGDVVLSATGGRKVDVNRAVARYSAASARTATSAAGMSHGIGAPRGSAARQRGQKPETGTVA